MVIQALRLLPATLRFLADAHSPVALSPESFRAPESRSPVPGKVITIADELGCVGDGSCVGPTNPPPTPPPKCTSNCDIASAGAGDPAAFLKILKEQSFALTARAESWSNFSQSA
jgi:hypothetical protein